MGSILKPGSYLTAIPVRVIHYASDAPEQWEERWRKWFASGRTDWKVWAQFELIARERGFDRFNACAYFPEAQAALELHTAGYSCWHGPPLFPDNKKIGRAKNDIAAIVAELAASGLPRPSDSAHRITPRPRNPDLAAFRRGHPWRFAEVKQPRENIEPGQLAALAVLRELLHAEVAVIRVVPDGVVLKQSEVPCAYTVT